MNAMPTWEEFNVPVLTVLSDGAVRTLRELQRDVSDAAGLTDEQRAETLASGQSRSHNRIGWAASYLNRVDALNRPARGRYLITERGRELLRQHPDRITETDLKALAKEGDEWWIPRASLDGHVSTVDHEAPTTSLDPTEQVEQGVARIHEEVASELLSRLCDQEPAFFESAVVKLLLAMGYGGVGGRGVTNGLTNDGGIDGVIDQDVLGELEARQGQFAHYRESLMQFSDQVPRVPIGRAGEIFRGRRFTKKDYVPEGVSAIHYGEMYTHFGTSASEVITHVRSDLAPNLRFARPGDVIIAEVGETVDDVGKATAWMGIEDVAIHDGCYGFRHAMNPVFVSYYLQTRRYNADKSQHVARAKVKRLSLTGLKQIEIPVPSRGEQDRIVAVLNNFDALVGNLSVGLPAELAARRKQYEYYRDRLLTFDEAV